MRKFAIVLTSFVLFGCANTGTGGMTPDQITALVQQIQAYAAAACSFQPAAASVEALIAAFYPAAAPFTAIVNQVGDAICKAPVTASVVKRGAVVQTRIVQTPKGPVVIKGGTYR